MQGIGFLGLGRRSRRIFDESMFVPIGNVAAPSGELLIDSRRRRAVEFAKRDGPLAAYFSEIFGDPCLH